MCWAAEWWSVGGLLWSAVRYPGMEVEQELELESESESELEGGGVVVSGSAVRRGGQADTQIDGCPDRQAFPCPPSGPAITGVGVAARSAVRRGGAGLRRGLDREWKREGKGNLAWLAVTGNGKGEGKLYCQKAKVRNSLSVAEVRNQDLKSRNENRSALFA